MALLDDQNSETGESDESRSTDYTAIIILAILCPVFFTFRHIGKTDLGLNVAVCLGMCLIAIRIRWDLRTQPWFWGIVLFVLGLHVPLFFLIQWPHIWVPGLALLPIGLVDVLIILGAVRLVEKFIGKPSPPGEGA